MPSAEEQMQMDAVRTMKNMVIGNVNKKTLFVRLGAVPLLLAIIHDSPWDLLRLQASVALGSLALGSREDVHVLINHGAIQVLVDVVLSNQPQLVEAGARSLKFLMQSQADQLARIVSPQMLAQLVERLDADVHGIIVAELVSTIVARCCVTQDLQTTLVSSGGLQRLVTLLSSTNHEKLRDAALDAIATLTRDNEPLTQRLLGLQARPHLSPVTLILSLVKNGSPQTRLLASQCATHMAKCLKDTAFVQEVKSIVLPALVKLLDAPAPTVQEQTPFVLASLVSESEAYQAAASDTDAITKLAAFVRTPEDSISLKLREASLLAMAAICLQKEECRKQVVDAKVLPHVIAALSHPEPGIRGAACQLSRSLSRSVKTLRTALVDAGIAMSLFNLLSDSNVAVQRVACATICNIVLDFSPMKKMILDNQGVRKLVALLQLDDSQLKLNALWAIKNMMYEADLATKDAIMNELTYPKLLRLIGDDDPGIQEQALNLLRNLSANKAVNQEEMLDKIFAGMGPQLQPILENKIDSGQTDVILQTLYICVNIATGNLVHKSLVMSQTILARLLTLLTHDLAAIRLASVWCVINLTFPGDADASERVQILRQMGFKTQLQRLSTDTDQDVRDRVKSALGSFVDDEMERLGAMVVD